MDQHPEKHHSSEHSWLNIESFPDFSSHNVRLADKPEESEESENEYIEFDPHLFLSNTGIPEKKISLYGKDPLKLIQKNEKLKRKAIVKLSHDKPMIVDKSDPSQIKFLVDLHGYTTKHKYPVRFEYKKVSQKIILGRAKFDQNFNVKERYYSFVPSNITTKLKVLEKEFIIRDGAKVPDFELPSSSGSETESNNITRKVSYLNKKVNENPGDIDAWMKLVDIQHEKLGKNVSNKTVAESQLAVLENAIGKNPKSEELLLRRLYITYNVSDSSSLRTALDRIVFAFPNKISFWSMYFWYIQADFSKINQKYVLDLYSKSVLKIESLKSTSVISSQRLAEPLGSQFQIKLICQLYLFILGTDHLEKLISLSQLLIEFNFSRHPELGLHTYKHADLLLYLESFWDSDSPKIGQEGSKGFYDYAKGNKSAVSSIYISERIQVFDKFFEEPNYDQTVISEYEHQIVETLGDRQNAWLTIENLRSYRDILPAKSSQDVEDIERIVLFDDIKSLIVKLDHSLNFELAILFLLALGVPVPTNFCPNIHEHLKEGLIFSDTILQFPDILQQFTLTSHGKNLYLCKKLSPIWLHFRSDDPASNLPTDPKILNFIRRLFSQFLAYKYFDENQRKNLSYVWLQYEVLVATLQPSNCCNFDYVLTFSKKLLSLPENRQDYCLWMLYSSALLFSGKSEIFVKTVTRLINTVRSVSYLTDKTYGILLIFFVQNVVLNDLVCLLDANFIELLIHEFFETNLGVSYKSCLDLTNAIMTKIGGATNESLLACFNLIWCQFFETFLTRGTALAISNLIKWIEYCSKNCVIASDSTLDLDCYPFKQRKYNKDSYYYRLCLMISERFSSIIWHVKMYAHVNYASFSNLIYLCIVMFPSSVPILQWFYRYLQTEPSSIAFRPCFNYLLSESINSPSLDLGCWLFSLYAEISYVEHVLKRFDDEAFVKESSTYHRLVAQFEKLCSNASFMFRPLLWRLYLRTLNVMNHKEGVKSVFYRALQHVPWCKDLYMDCVYFGVLDLKSVVDIMVEKNIRLRLPIEELDLL